MARLCLLLVVLSFFFASCNSSSSSSTTNSCGVGLNLSLSSTTALVPQGGASPGVVSYSISPFCSNLSVNVENAPNSITVQVSSPVQTGGLATGTITVTSSPAVPAGTYTVLVSVTTSGGAASAPLMIVVAPQVNVSSSADTTQGVNGQLLQFMSTSFQPAEWDYQFFLNHQVSEPAQLNALGPQHIRIQGISEAVPWKTNSNPQQPTDWDFTMLDDVVQPVLGSADHSPEFQIAVTPSFFSLPSPLTSSDANLQLFVSYCQNLVLYYNKGGFTWGGKAFRSASPYPITWWGIFNEYNINGLTPADYVVLYNAVVPAMLAVDPTIQFSALELSDYDYQVGDPRNNLPTFVAAPTSGGVNAQVSVASTHFYSSCDQSDTDQEIFSTIPGFVSDLQYFRTQFGGSANPNLSNVAIWVTENNVNADYANSNGQSTCNPNQKFVLDTRGTSPFFTAWRPYVYSQLAKAGNQALYHWDYDADAQYSEVDYNTSNRYLSYWVDATLGQMFPVSATTNPGFLSVTSTDTNSVEALATKNPDGTYVVMITNYAVNAPGDNNGPGTPRTVIVDVSALGNYHSVVQTTLNSKTDANAGPSPFGLTPAPQLSVNLPGYGTTFLHIQP